MQKVLQLQVLLVFFSVFWNKIKEETIEENLFSITIKEFIKKILFFLQSTFSLAASATADVSLSVDLRYRWELMKVETFLPRRNFIQDFLK